jgi:hypothetical protein
MKKKTISGVQPSTIGSAMGEIDMERRDKTSTDSETFSIQTTLDLNKGDKIWLEIDFLSSPVASLYDDYRHYTHFTGILLEEDSYQNLAYWYPIICQECDVVVYQHQHNHPCCHLQFFSQANHLSIFGKDYQFDIQQ